MKIGCDRDGRQSGTFDPNAWADWKQANLLVLSDTHGSRRLFELALQRHGGAIDLILHLGDHGGPLQELTDLARQAARPLLCVAGNCDSQRSSGSPLPDSLRLTVAGCRLFLTHGHRFGVKHGLDELAIVGGEEPVAADLVLYGHTHHYHDETRVSADGRCFRLFNPGSASLSYYNPEATCALVHLSPVSIEIERLTADLLS